MLLAANKWLNTSKYWSSVLFILGSCVRLLQCACGTRSTDLLKFTVRSCQRGVYPYKPAGAMLIAGPVWCLGLMMMASGGLNNREQSLTAFMYPHIPPCAFGDAARDKASWCLLMAPPTHKAGLIVRSLHTAGMSPQRTTWCVARTSRTEVALTRCWFALL